MKQIKPIAFTPAPARMAGPKVTIPEKHLEKAEVEYVPGVASAAREVVIKPVVEYRRPRMVTGGPGCLTDQQRAMRSRAALAS